MLLSLITASNPEVSEFGLYTRVLDVRVDSGSFCWSIVNISDCLVSAVYREGSPGISFPRCHKSAQGNMDIPGYIEIVW